MLRPIRVRPVDHAVAEEVATGVQDARHRARVQLVAHGVDEEAVQRRERF